MVSDASNTHTLNHLLLRFSERRPCITNSLTNQRCAHSYRECVSATPFALRAMHLSLRSATGLYAWKPTPENRFFCFDRVTVLAPSVSVMLEEIHRLVVDDASIAPDTVWYEFGTTNWLKIGPTFLPVRFDGNRRRFRVSRRPGKQCALRCTIPQLPALAL